MDAVEELLLLADTAAMIVVGLLVVSVVKTEPEDSVIVSFTEDTTAVSLADELPSIEPVDVVHQLVTLGVHHTVDV